MRLNKRMMVNELYNTLTNNAPYDTGNLRDNGIVLETQGGNAQILLGTVGAPYTLYTERTSFKPGWIAKSRVDFLQYLARNGGKISL